MNKDSLSFFDKLSLSLEDNRIREPLKYALGIATGTALLDFAIKGKPYRSLVAWTAVFIPVLLGSSLYLSYTERLEAVKTAQFQAGLRYRTLTEGTKSGYSKDK